MAGRMEEGLALTREVLQVVNMRVHRWAWQAMLSFFVQRLWIGARGLKFRERQRDPNSGLPTCFAWISALRSSRGSPWWTRFALIRFMRACCCLRCGRARIANQPRPLFGGRLLRAEG